MAGNVTVSNQSAALSTTSGGTTDFTKSGFGTPKACQIVISFDATDNTSVAAEGKVSIGFSDFTNNYCISHQDEDGSLVVDSDARKSNTKAYVILDTDGSVLFSGTASAITDGVRLTHTAGEAPASAFFAAVTMYGGADLKVSLDRVTAPGTKDGTVVTTTGIDQDLVFFISSDVGAEDASSTGIENSFGVAHIDTSNHTTFVNRCIGWASDHGNSKGKPVSTLHTSRCLQIVTGGGSFDWAQELTAATTTSYTLTEREADAGLGKEIYALALDLDDRGSKIGSVDAPTSGTTWAPSVSLGFTPQLVGLALTRLDGEDGTNSSEFAGSHGLSANTGSGEETCHSWYNEQDAEVTNTNNLFRSRVIDLRDDDTTTVMQDHSHSSFDSGGWTYTINTENEDTARKWFYWAIEEGTVVGTTMVAAQGSYAITGQPSDLLQAHSMPADQGGYTLTGQAAVTSKDTPIVASQGSYALTGQPAVLLWNHLITVSQGVYTLTGIAADTLVGSTMFADQGSYTLTGQPANLLWNHLTPADQGSYVLTGQPADTLLTIIMVADQGGYTYTGFDAVTFVTIPVILVADQGSYALTGFEAITTDSGAALGNLLIPLGRRRRRSR